MRHSTPSMTLGIYVPACAALLEPRRCGACLPSRPNGSVLVGRDRQAAGRHYDSAKLREAVAALPRIGDPEPAAVAAPEAVAS